MQYAHARVASVMKELAARGLRYDDAMGRAAAMANGGSALDTPAAKTLLAAISRYPEIIEHAAAQRAPHTLAHYLRDLANEVHSFYAAERVLVPEDDARAARVFLLRGAQQVIRNGLAILGASAPESM
jgi:arginyl-tRNA synthetase